MTHRFCPTCNAEVEDVGGFCLLGHSIRLATAVPSMGELRAEVDKAFEDARAEVAQLLAAAPVPPAPVEAPVVTPPPPPGPAQVQSEASSEAGTTSHAVWETLSKDVSEPLAYEDPIAAFAPAPRMDWGPDRKTKRRRKDG
jgi:hypothetical protein